ncbi:MAG TPA: hypothetical protein VFO60_03680, partial [Candidatus Dormibacteraeota bacterium]|nr:hypothetical protein [Candidatus Dormibacteraeota bacterium]
KRVQLNGSPVSMLLSTDGSTAYALDTEHATVLPVDLAAGKLEPAIAAGKLPVDMRLSADGKVLYVTDNLTPSLIPVDTASRSAQPSQKLPQGAESYVPDPTGRSALVAFYGPLGQPGTVALFSRGTQAGSVSVGHNRVDDLVFSPDGSVAWAMEAGVGSEAGSVYPITMADGSVGAPIAVGHRPAALRITPDGALGVVPNEADNTVTVIDLRARRPVATVAVDATPGEPAISRDGRTAWIPCALDRTLVPVDLSTRRAGAHIALGNAPSTAGVTADGTSAWVLFPTTAGSVALVDGASGTVGSPSGVGNEPSVDVSPDGAVAAAVSSLDDGVQAVDTGTGAAAPAVRVARGPEASAVVPGSRRVVVVSYGNGQTAGTLSVVDVAAQKVVATVPLSPAPGSLVLSKDGATAYVAFPRTNAVQVVDLASARVTGTISLRCSPDGGLSRTANGRIVAVCTGSTWLVPLDGTTMKAGTPIVVTDSPRVIPAPSGDTVYVDGAGDIQAVDIATGAVRAEHQQTGNLFSLAVTRDGKTVLAIDNTGETLDSLDPSSLSVVRSLYLGGRPDGLAISSDGRLAFVLDVTAQLVRIVDLAAWSVAHTTDVSPDATSIVTPPTAA